LITEEFLKLDFAFIFSVLSLRVGVQLCHFYVYRKAGASIGRTLEICFCVFFLFSGVEYVVPIVLFGKRKRKDKESLLKNL
jgi:hypothetical protein